MGTALAIAYLIGMIATAGVARARIGISQIGRLSMVTILGSLPWFLSQLASMFVWPVLLCVWFARGRPESPWKAVTTGDGTLLVRRRRNPASRPSP